MESLGSMNHMGNKEEERHRQKNQQANRISRNKNGLGEDVSGPNSAE